MRVCLNTADHDAKAEEEAGAPRGAPDPEAAGGVYDAPPDSLVGWEGIPIPLDAFGVLISNSVLAIEQCPDFLQ